MSSPAKSIVLIGSSLGSGNLSSSGRKKTTSTLELVAQSDPPSQLESTALRVVAGQAHESGDLVTVPPISFGAVSTQLSALEEAAIRALPHLREIFTRPYERLQAEEEITSVGRARRPARRSPEVLASHTQHWAGRRFGGVTPSRILSTRNDSNPNIYENQLAAALVFRLHHRVLVPRLRELRLAQQLARRLAEVGQQLGDQHWELAHRGYTRWNKAREARVPAGLEDALEDLERLDRGLRALMADSHLYNAVDHRTEPSIELHVTNLLANDRHYRYVNLVWTKLQKHELESRESSEQIQQRLAAAQEHMVDFSEVLLVQALAQIGASASDVQPKLRPGVSIPFDLEGMPFDVTRDMVGRLLLRVTGRSLILRPVASTLASEASRRQLLQLVTARRSETVVLYLGSPLPEDRWSGSSKINEYAELQDLPADRRDGVGLVPVSPMIVASVERVGRVCLRFLVDAAWQGLRSPVAVPSLLRQEWRSTWVGADPEMLHLSGPVRESEIGHDLAAIRGAVKHLPHGRVHEVRQALADLEEAVGLRLRDSGPLLRCLQCHSDHVRSVRRGDGFAVLCAECDGELRVDACANCRTPYLVFEPGHALPAVRDDAGWIDRWAGSSVLAAPCWVDANRFVCPSCGACPSAGSRDCGRCEVFPREREGSLPATHGGAQ